MFEVLSRKETEEDYCAQTAVSLKIIQILKIPLAHIFLNSQTLKICKKTNFFFFNFRPEYPLK